MRLVDATPLECQAKERKENEWNQRVSPTSWAHAEESFLHRIEDAPTVDAVVVTRCKDCKYLVNATVNDNGFLICDISDMEIAPDDFCSYGEPKERTHA